ncbi:MAG TPA: hypothetical protein VLJ60_10745 [bacterium]|nr:hypothetical protein [bacterium]
MSNAPIANIIPLLHYLSVTIFVELKDGRKWFGFSKMDVEVTKMLARI